MRNGSVSAAAILLRTFSIDGAGSHSLVELLRSNDHDPALRALAQIAVGESVRRRRGHVPPDEVDVTDGHRQRVAELLAIFAGREKIANIGQFGERDARPLAWAVRRGLILEERRPWPGPLVGTCIKTFYVKIGC